MMKLGDAKCLQFDCLAWDEKLGCKLIEQELQRPEEPRT